MSVLFTIFPWKSFDDKSSKNFNLAQFLDQGRSLTKFKVLMQLCQELKSSTKVHLRGKGSLLFPTKIYWASTARCFLFFNTNFLDACFVSSSTVILGSLEKKVWRGPTIFHESLGRCLTWLSLCYFEGVREAGAPLLESSLAFTTPVQKETFCCTEVCVFGLSKTLSKKCCLWPSSHDCKLRKKMKLKVILKLSFLIGKKLRKSRAILES